MKLITTEKHQRCTCTLEMHLVSSDLKQLDNRENKAGLLILGFKKKNNTVL